MMERLEVELTIERRTDYIRVLQYTFRYLWRGKTYSKYFLYHMNSKSWTVESDDLFESRDWAFVFQSLLRNTVKVVRLI